MKLLGKVLFLLLLLVEIPLYSQRDPYAWFFQQTKELKTDKAITENIFSISHVYCRENLNASARNAILEMKVLSISKSKDGPLKALFGILILPALYHYNKERLPQILQILISYLDRENCNLFWASCEQLLKINFIDSCKVRKAYIRAIESKVQCYKSNSAVQLVLYTLLIKQNSKGDELLNLLKKLDSLPENFDNQSFFKRLKTASTLKSVAICLRVGAIGNEWNGFKSGFPKSAKKVSQILQMKPLGVRVD